MIGRKFIRQYRVEGAYLTAKNSAAVLRLQRCYRIWVAKRVRRALHVAHVEKVLANKYLAVSAKKIHRDDVQHSKTKLRALYTDDVKKDWMGCYALRHHTRKNLTQRSVQTIAGSNAILQLQARQKEKSRQEQTIKDKRFDFIMSKCRSNTVFEKYYGDEISSRRRHFMHGLNKQTTAPSALARKLPSLT